MEQLSTRYFIPDDKERESVKVLLKDNPMIFSLEGICYSHDESYSRESARKHSFGVVFSFPVAELNKLYDDDDMERLQYISSAAKFATALGPQKKELCYFCADYDEFEEETRNAVTVIFEKHIAYESLLRIDKLRPNMTKLLHEVTDRVENYQNKTGVKYIDTQCPTDTIYGYEFDEDMNCMVECEVKAIRVRGGHMEIVTASVSNSNIYTDKELDDNLYWKPIMNDSYDWVPILLNICEFLYSHIRP